MSLKKTVAIAAAAGALAAISVPAMALENEFHGMYKMMGYQGNFFEGTTLSKAQADTLLKKDARSGFFAEQRARIQYTAKASADLKLVTHFELDTRFGGKSSAYLGTASGNDSGNLDADQLTLETKSIYLDFNCPITGANVKAGMQPWADSYQSLFLLADMTGLNVSKKFGPATAGLAWFRFDDNTATTAQRLTADLFVLDGKFDINKDMKVGASYYYANNDTYGNAFTSAPGLPFLKLNVVGLNADMTFGPANIKPFAAYQFGDRTDTQDIKAYVLGAVTKTKVGSGAINFSAMYLSGDDNSVNPEKSFTTLGINTTYFNAANMWLLVRNGGAVNSSSSVLGNDMTVGGRGLMGVFAGYEGTAGKVFYNANLGYAQTAESRNAEDSAIGTEINAQVGYKLYDNLSVSGAVAYVVLGDGLSSTTTAKRFGGSANADDPYAVNLQLSYTF